MYFFKGKKVKNFTYEVLECNRRPNFCWWNSRDLKLTESIISVWTHTILLPQADTTSTISLHDILRFHWLHVLVFRYDSLVRVKITSELSNFCAGVLRQPCVGPTCGARCAVSELPMRKFWCESYLTRITIWLGNWISPTVICCIGKCSLYTHTYWSVTYQSYQNTVVISILTWLMSDTSACKHYSMKN